MPAVQPPAPLNWSPASGFTSCASCCAVAHPRFVFCAQSPYRLHAVSYTSQTLMSISVLSCGAGISSASTSPSSKSIVLKWTGSSSLNIQTAFSAPVSSVSSTATLRCQSSSLYFLAISSYNLFDSFSPPAVATPNFHSSRRPCPNASMACSSAISSAGLGAPFSSHPFRSPFLSASACLLHSCCSGVYVSSIALFLISSRFTCCSSLMLSCSLASKLTTAFCITPLISFRLAAVSGLSKSFSLPPLR